MFFQDNKKFILIMKKNITILILFLTLFNSNYILANDASINKEREEDSKKIEDVINGVFSPIVDILDRFLFFDPFYLLGIYDPVVYEQGVPVLGKSLKGRVSFKKETNLIIGQGTNFTESLKEGSKIIIKNKLYEVSNIKDDKRLEISENIDYTSSDEIVNSAIVREIPFIVLWLIIGAIFFTFKMNFINFRGFRHAINLVRGVYDKPKSKGEVSHFQALATALSGTVGLGNIAGVAIAVSVGGPGATFWMIIAGLLGMSSKFVECTLGIKYRNIDKKGEVSGGPMYYLSKGLDKRNLKNLGRVLAVVFAIFTILASFGGGNMFQANQSFSHLANEIPALEGNGFYFGLIMAILAGVVIIGGVKSISKVTEKIVPFMAVLYVIASLTVIFYHFSDIPYVIRSIIDGAFSSPAIKGGFIGVLIMGFRRAAFSNEAGIGSSPIAHSAAKTSRPISEGTVSLLEPFIDTVFICTMTSFVIIITGRHQETYMNLEGAVLTSNAFGSVLSWLPKVLMIAIFLFAFSTIISWSYYGLKAFTYLFGNKKVYVNTYKIIFLCFVIVGASSSLSSVTDFSDMVLLSMGIPNILGLYILVSEIKKDKNKYFSDLKEGKIKKYK